MRWKLDWHDLEEKFAVWAEQGDETKAWKARVDLFDDVLPIWNAFNALHKRRFGEMGTRRIEFGEIIDWLNLYAVTDQDEREYFAECIDAMDDEFMAWESSSKPSRDESAS